MEPIQIRMRGEDDRNGNPVFEQILVEPITEEIFRVVRSPGLIGGFAASDIIRYDQANCTFTIITRSGNHCVQFYFRGDIVDNCRNQILPLVKELRGWLDGMLIMKKTGLLVFTFPPTVMMEELERLRAFTLDHFPGSNWLYGTDL